MIIVGGIEEDIVGGIEEEALFIINIERSLKAHPFTRPISL